MHVTSSMAIFRVHIAQWLFSASIVKQAYIQLWLLRMSESPHAIVVWTEPATDHDVADLLSLRSVVAGSGSHLASMNLKPSVKRHESSLQLEICCGGTSQLSDIKKVDSTSSFRGTDVSGSAK